jgi:hypothetical protein
MQPSHTHWKVTIQLKRVNSWHNIRPAMVITGHSHPIGITSPMIRNTEPVEIVT